MLDLTQIQILDNNGLDRLRAFLSISRDEDTFLYISDSSYKITTGLFDEKGNRLTVELNSSIECDKELIKFIQRRNIKDRESLTEHMDKYIEENRL